MPPGEAGHGTRPRTSSSTRTTAQPPSAAPAPSRGGWRRITTAWGRFVSSLTLSGVCGAVLAFALSTTPSLIPRGWSFQAVSAGIALAIGYGAGTALRALLARVGVTRSPGPELRRRLRLLLLAAGGGIAVVTLLTGAASQRALAELWGIEPTTHAAVPATLAVALLFGLGLLLLSRGLRGVVRALGRLLGRWIPRPIAGVVSLAVVSVLLVMLVTGLFQRLVLGSITPGFQARDSEVPAGAERPTANERSGSPDSTQAWETLGFQGRAFVAGGPTAEQITAVTGREAMTPIRVYAGLSSQDVDPVEADLDALADQVVAELDRTGAWDRSVVVVATATGTGWVDPLAAAALEYVTDGDSAIASMQYSFNPSWVTLVLDLERPQLAGQALFEAVNERWLELPEDSRPLLLNYGVSLGSYGSQSAFTSVAAVEARSDGAVWTGTPYFTSLWERLTQQRDPGTPQMAPVLDGGESVRWGTANTGSQGFEDLGPAEGVRIAYLQHPSDAVTWWWLPTFWERDDWFTEPRMPDVLDGVRWWPVITGLQLMGDNFAAGSPSVPLGFGHNYGGGYVDAWSWTTGVSLSEAELAAIRQVVDATPRG